MKCPKFDTEFNFSIEDGIKVDEEDYLSKLTSCLNLTLEKLKRKGYYIVSCTIVSKEEIHKLNKTYRDTDRPTDVLSFAYNEGDESFSDDKDFFDLGDIYICLDVCDEQCSTYNLSLDEEVCYLFIHGLLHLFNYDHVHNDDEKKIMFDIQNDIFASYQNKEKRKHG